MAKQLLVVALLGACAQQQSSTPLAKLGSSNIEVVAKGQVNIELHVDESNGCPVLGDDVRALFDGQPMQMTHGGYDTNATGCYPIAFWFNNPPMSDLVGFERGTNSSQLVVQDKSATWSVNTSRLFANDFADDTANSQIIWTDVATITTAQISPAVPITVTGNVIHYVPGTSIQWVDATAHPATTLCDGPANCFVNLEGSKQLGPISP